MKLETAEICKVLGVDTRVKIIELLKHKGPLGANEIAEQVNITPAAVSQHLKILRHAGVVRSERKGYWIPYSIDENAMEEWRTELNKVCSCGCHGHGKIRPHLHRGSCLDSLKKYEKELENELFVVREKINKLEKSK